MPANPPILVADDDPLVRELILTRLRLAGFDVHGARDGREAVERARALRPQALVLDINMPELDGFGVLAALRELGLTPATPVLVLTARHAADDVRKAIKLGAKDYLAKPFTQEQLMARIGRLLRAPIAPPPAATPRPTVEI
jgi:two-component system OmpR family response regulator